MECFVDLVAASSADWFCNERDVLPACITYRSIKWTCDRLPAAWTDRVEEQTYETIRCISKRHEQADALCKERSTPNDGMFCPASAVDRSYCNVAGLRLGRNFNLLGVAPQAFEVVELARRGHEHVNDEVEIVEQHPIAALVAFDQGRFCASFCDSFLNGVGDRLNLSSVRAGADNKEIREG
jgi:hypothetical protein